MTKEEFNKLAVLKQLEYINSLLVEGKSLRNIGLELNMSKSTFRARFFNIGYIRNEDTNQYCYDNTVAIQSPQKAHKAVVEPITEHDTKVLQKYDCKEKSQKYDKDILELINKKTEILEMLKHYKNSALVIKKSQINISSLPQEMQKDIINKSIKVYNPIYKCFDDICNRYGSIKKQDMISLALYEFCDKYKK